jgi:hypothetical protein
LEVLESKYRDTPTGSKKYVKRITEYINFLVSHGKIVEAKYYFINLYAVKPNHIKTIRLGYSLSITTFDNEGVRKFDKMLYDSKPNDIELYWFRLKYYLSVNNHKGCEECCEFLLSKETTHKYLSTIIEACLNLESYKIAVYLIKYLNKERLKLTDQGSNEIKKIVIRRLASSLGNIKHG